MNSLGESSQYSIVRTAAMDNYMALLQRAAAKRDRLVTAANREYVREVAQIHARQCGLDEGPARTATAASYHLAIVGMVREVMPTDRAFTVADIVYSLRLAHPGMIFRSATLKFVLPRMGREGIISKLGLNEDGHTLWAADGVMISESLRGEKALITLVETVLNEFGPLAPIDLISKLQGRGYRPKSDPRRLVGILRKAAKKQSGRFLEGMDGKWSLNHNGIHCSPLH